MDPEDLAQQAFGLSSLRDDVRGLLIRGQKELLEAPSIVISDETARCVCELIRASRAEPMFVTSLSVVFRCELEEEQTVAVKIAVDIPHTLSLRQCLEHEYKVLRELASAHVPHVLRPLQFMDRDGVTVLVIRWVGTTMLDVVDSEVPVTAKQAWCVVHACAAVYVAAHARGIIHGDLKLENVLLDNDGVPYIIDWNISGRVTRASYSAVTSPCDGSDATPAGDMFRLGALLYSLVYRHLLCRGCDKRVQFPASVFSLECGNDVELMRLMRALLHADPSCRPTAVDTLRTAQSISDAPIDSPTGWRPRHV